MKKNTFFSFLKVDFCRVFSSAGFYLSIICTFFVYYLSVFSEMQLSAGSDLASVHYYFDCANSFNSLADILLVVATLPFAFCIYEDYQNKYFRLVLVRTNTTYYIWSKILICFFSTFLAILLGLLFFILFLSIQLPIVPDDISIITNSCIFRFFIINDKPFISLLLLCIIRGFAAAFWSIAAMTCSAYITNYFIVFTSPLIINKLFSLIYITCFSQEKYSLSFITEGMIDMGSWYASILYPCLLFVTLSFILSLIFKKRIREVFHNA